MKTESELIEDFDIKYEAYQKAEKQLDKHFRNKIAATLNQAKSTQDFNAVKEMVRPMPECASKVLIFRTILIKQGEL